MTRSLILIAFAAMSSFPVAAADLWAVGGVALTQTGRCEITQWFAEALLHNVGSTDALVPIVHISNHGLSGLQPIVIPAGRTVGARSFFAVGEEPLWVMHLDVPDNVGVEGRLEFFRHDPCSSWPPETNPRGKIAMPTFRRLVPAGEPQRHFGTDLGGQRVRLNVAIYNAVEVPASANIVVHRPFCGNAVDVTRSVQLPPDTILQVPLGELPCDTGVWWPSYVTVTVDQPSFSFVSTLAVGTPLVSASVSCN